MSRTVAFVAAWDWVLYNFRLPVARALREHGVEVVLICPTGRWTDDLRREGFRHVPWPVQRRSINPLREAGAIARLRTIYRREQFDLVHHFTIKPNLYGSIAAASADVPAVVNTFSGLGWLFSEAPLARGVRFALRPALRRAFHDDRVWTIVQNRDDLARLKRMGLVTQDRVRLIAGSGVDVERFTPDVSERQSTPRVLFAGRLLRDKGIVDYVAAARAITGRGLEAEFIAAGEPDTGNPNSVDDAQVRSWDEKGPVRFVGHRSDLPDILRTCDVAVLPTSYNEGVPRFLLEAGASGLPLVATDTPGCRDVVLDDETGILVPPNDVDALTSAICRLLTDEELRGRMGRAAREHIVAHHALPSIVSQYLEMYRSVGLTL